MFRKKQAMKFFNFILLILFFVMIVMAISCQQKTESLGSKNSASELSETILKKIGVSRGICVVLGDTTGQFILELAKKSELLIYTQLTDEKNVETLRNLADIAGLYGTRIYVEQGGTEKIHLADNLADCVIGLNNLSKFSRKEIMRVLCPDGKAIIDQQEWIKPFPEGMDDWSHPYHNPDNNTQSNDKIIRAPYLTQFMSEPYYGPMTSVAVASAGRVFKAFGNIAFHEREEAQLNTLIGLNGFNGTLLWKRNLPSGLVLHRNIIIATPDRLYLGDDKSCKVINTVTGQLVDEIIPPSNIAGGTYWKWMGMENDVLFALVGEQEHKDPTMRWRREKHGWPWYPISKGYNQNNNPWGFGRNLLAIDPKTKKVLWSHHEEKPIDSRALCMKNGKIYVFRFGEFLACLNAKNGKEIWRKTIENAPELFNSIGEYLDRQGYQTNWRTRNYLMCSDDALYFAGPQIRKLLAVSTKDGSVLWENSYDNFQLILRDDGLYAISGQGDKISKKFDPLTGEILAELPTDRRACTRPNASSDAIFYRARGGTVRFDLDDELPRWISPMRPDCHNGVTIANGMLYWWPTVCDCQLSIYGIISVGSAGDFQFNSAATKAQRLEMGRPVESSTSSLLASDSDWPTFRKDNQGSVTSKATISTSGKLLWQFRSKNLWATATDILGHKYSSYITAPVIVDGIAFYSGSDGIVRAINSQTGKVLWKAYTGGAVRMAPTVWQNQLFVGSGDGWVYNFDARSGDLIWRFRVAPEERKIPIYGSLVSTWPAASGILVEDGIVYVAAGIVNYDGTHVYALDAVTGEIKWQNNSSGHLDKEAHTGVSVQGHLLLNDGKLYMPGGTSVSPAIYDASNGKCLNDPEPLKKCESTDPRGSELFKIGDKIVVSGKPFYSDPHNSVYDESVKAKMLIASVGKKDILWTNNRLVSCYPQINKNLLNNSVNDNSDISGRIPVWGHLDISGKPIWEFPCENSIAIAVCNDAVVIALETEIQVINLTDGKLRWSQPLESPPVPWGLAVGRDGRIIVSLENGTVVCFGGESTIPTPYLLSDEYFFGSTLVTLTSDPKGADIRYTLDGSDPNLNSKIYTKPIKIDKTTKIKMRTFKNSMVQSLCISTDVKKLDYSDTDLIDGLKKGLNYSYYEQVFQSFTEVGKHKANTSGVISTVSLDISEIEDMKFGLKFNGYLDIPKDGEYTFYLKSDDGSGLYINGYETINHDGKHGPTEKEKTLFLRAGKVPVQVKYYEVGGGRKLQLSWKGPGIEKQEIPASVFFYKLIR